MHKKISLSALVFALFLGAAMTCQAAGPYGYGPQLSPEQLQSAQKIFNDHYAGMDATRQALTAKRAELDAQLASPEPDSGRIEQLSREIGELRGKMLSARASVRSQLAKNGLPPDYFGPGNNSWNDNGGVWQGPGWHHNGGWGHHRGYRGHRGDWGPRGGWGCGGCW